jgi:hypothetical protein
VRCLLFVCSFVYISLKRANSYSRRHDARCDDAARAESRAHERRRRACHARLVDDRIEHVVDIDTGCDDDADESASAQPRSRTARRSCGARSESSRSQVRSFVRPFARSFVWNFSFKFTMFCRDTVRSAIVAASANCRRKVRAYLLAARRRRRRRRCRSPSSIITIIAAAAAAASRQRVRERWRRNRRRRRRAASMPCEALAAHWRPSSISSSSVRDRCRHAAPPPPPVRSVRIVRRDVFWICVIRNLRFCVFVCVCVCVCVALGVCDFVSSGAAADVVELAAKSVRKRQGAVVIGVGGDDGACRIERCAAPCAFGRGNHDADSSRTYVLGSSTLSLCNNDRSNLDAGSRGRHVEASPQQPLNKLLGSQRILSVFVLFRFFLLVIADCCLNALLVRGRYCACDALRCRHHGCAAAVFDSRRRVSLLRCLRFTLVR